MERIKVFMLDLPDKVKGMTVYSNDQDGLPFFTIIINARMDADTQHNTFIHEMKHINNYDFDSMIPADQIEVIRHLT